MCIRDSIRTNQIWPATSNVDYTGVKDPEYNKIPNAGYVDRKQVTYQSFGVIDLPQLFSNERIFKPSANNLIHVAKSENKDWNVYKLREPNDEGISFIEQEGIDDTAYLYTTVDLFNYVDSNQLQQADLSRFLDYTLMVKNVEISVSDSRTRALPGSGGPPNSSAQPPLSAKNMIMVLSYNPLLFRSLINLPIF